MRLLWAALTLQTSRFTAPKDQLTTTGIPTSTIWSFHLWLFIIRIKPDIVSPGDALLSANAAGTGKTSCSTIQMTGKQNI